MTSYGSDKAQAEEQFKQQLLELGLWKEIKVPACVSVDDRTPIRVKGKPLCRNIMDERRWVAVYYLDTSALVKRYVQEQAA